jgi:hypothetical protein
MDTNGTSTIDFITSVNFSGKYEANPFPSPDSRQTLGNTSDYVYMLIVTGVAILVMPKKKKPSILSLLSPRPYSTTQWPYQTNN